MKKSPVVPPVLKQFAGLWTMMEQPSKEKEWSLDQKFAQAKKAGFDAIGGRPNPEIPDLCAKHGMEFICYSDADRKTFRARLKAVLATKPARVNVQLGDHDTLPKEAAAVWVDLEKEAEQMGLNVDLEVHRDTCTETPEKVYEIADLYKEATGKKIRFCWDYSHIAVVKHLMPPYAKRLLVRPDLIKLARQFHFRPFNGHHCQVPATNGRGQETPEFKHYIEFVDELLAVWFAGAKGGEVMYASPEFGPVVSTYGMSCFPNVWKDAIYLRGKTEELWNAQVVAWKKKKAA